MKNSLATLRNVPITTATIASLFPKIVDTRQKVSMLEKNGEIIRLKKGLYVVSPEISDMMISTELIANHLYAPSYVSMETALRYYGLIPEAVYLMRSMTLKQSRTFVNSFGRFEFLSTSRKSYYIGIKSGECEGSYFQIATPEKALCDLVAQTRGINLRYVGEAKEYLESYLRFDMDALMHFDTDILGQYAKVGKKGSSIRTIIKLIQS